MGISWPGQKKRETDGRSGNQKWKDQYGTWVVRSTAAAVGAHIALFLIWPAWNVSYQKRERDELEAVQLRPVASFGALSDPVDSPTTALRTEDEIEFDLARAGAGEQENIDDVLERLGYPEPRVINPIEPDNTDGVPTPPKPLNLDLELALVIDRPARLPDAVAYPLIRNPISVVRFLRTRYNPVYRGSGPQGTVTVVMWVNERGAVDWSEVRESSGHEVLDEIALALFNDVALFRAARSHGTRIPVALVLSVPLSLPW